jgi:hypothetical protein
MGDVRSRDAPLFALPGSPPSGPGNARDKPPPDRPLLADMLRQMDEARNASPHTPQQASDMVRERNERLAGQAEKIQALRRAREAQSAALQRPEGEWMGRKRELIDTGTDKRYVRRNKLGTSFVESDDVGRSLAADRRKRGKTKVKSGQGDKGDRARPKTKRKAASKGRKKTAARKGAARKSARKKGTKRR